MTETTAQEKMDAFGAAVARFNKNMDLLNNFIHGDESTTVLLGDPPVEVDSIRRLVEKIKAECRKA